MSGFALQHPWMIFWIIIVTLMVIDSMVENWCNRNKSAPPDCDCAACRDE